MRARVEREGIVKGLQLICCIWRCSKHLFRDFHFQRMPPARVSKTAECIRVTIGVRHVGLDVEDRGSVHQIGSHDTDYRPLVRMQVYARDAHGRETEIIRTEGRAGGPHPYPFISAQNRRTNGRCLPCIPVFREFPYQPYIIETVQTPQRICIAEFGREYNATLSSSQSALARDSELTAERTVIMGYRRDFQFYNYLIQVSHLLNILVVKKLRSYRFTRPTGCS